jgi:ribosomal protein L2
MCIGNIGRVSNIFCLYSKYSSFSKCKLIKHKSQTVRGIAKNPVDHPNGGRSKIKQPFLNP